MQKYHLDFDIEFKTHDFPGILVALEGIDGSGKTTQAHKLVAHLEKQGKRAIYTKEPTDTPTGKLIRLVLAGEVKMPPIALQYLLSADRAVHQIAIENYLKEGFYVVTDRYFWSAVAYGMADLEKEGDHLLIAFSILSQYHQFILPDVTFYLEVSPEVAMKRIDNMGKENEIYERGEKLTKIVKGYVWLIEKFPEKFVMIQDDRGVEEITEEILGKVLSMMKSV